MTMAMLDLNWAKTEEYLVEYIRDYMAQAGFQNVVLGMSGGLDSSICAALACKALGPEHVFGFALPYGDEQENDTVAAENWANQLKIYFEEIGIEDPVRHFIQLTVCDKSQCPDYRLRKGNICARSRMIILYDLSKRHNALVMGTGNKTEYWLGYTTLWGDMACSFTPIGGIFKTQERKLAQHMKLPEEIIQKPPTAGLWEGQTDEGEMGFTYEQADAVLSVLLPRFESFMGDLSEDTEDNKYYNEGLEELKKFGIASEITERVWRRVKAMEFKRRMPHSPVMTPQVLAWNKMDVDDLFGGTI